MRLLLVLFLMGFTPASQAASSILEQTATIAAECEITSSPHLVAAYDPLQAEPSRTSGLVRFRCSKGLNPLVSFSSREEALCGAASNFLWQARHSDNPQELLRFSLEAGTGLTLTPVDCDPMHSWEMSSLSGSGGPLQDTREYGFEVHVTVQGGQTEVQSGHYGIEIAVELRF